MLQIVATVCSPVLPGGTEWLACEEQLASFHWRVKAWVFFRSPPSQHYQRHESTYKIGENIFDIVTVATQKLPKGSYRDNNFRNNQQRKFRNATSILEISGKPSKNSNTDRLVQAALESSGMTSEFIKRSKINPQKNA